MEWSQSYSATWRVFRVNRKTWADAENMPNVISANVVKTADGAAIESGSLSVTGELPTDYYRIVMTAEQSGEVERVDVATLLFCAQSGQIDYGVVTYDVDGHSVLYPASVTTLVTGSYAPAGVNGVEYAMDLLKQAINAPVEAVGSFVLNDSIVHEPNSSVLDAVWEVLDAGGYVMQINGRGHVVIMPQPTEPALVIDNKQSAVLLDEITFDADTEDIPNRYIVVDGVNITMAENNDAKSEISVVVRGYHVDEVDTSPKPVNGETLSAYAERRLKEKSVLKEEYEYSREYVPDVYPYSRIRASLENINGDLTVHSQSIACGNGITVQEKAVKEKKLYE